MFIDSHFHLGYSKDFYFHDITLDRCLKTMDALGISYCINANLIGLTYGTQETGIEENKRAYELSQGRILSYFAFDPNQGEKCIEAMETHFDRNIFKAIKIHPSFHGFYGSAPEYEIVWRYAKAKGLPIMSHTWAVSAYNPVQKLSYPPVFENYIRKYPEVSFICGHSGGRYDGIMQCVKLAIKYKNVFLDTSGDVYNNRFIEFLVGKIGSKKVLFGSDALWMDWKTQLGMILGADISLQDKRNILYENAAAIFGVQLKA